MAQNDQPEQDPKFSTGSNGGDGFDEIVRQHQAWVRGYLRARLQDRASADDLAQDVFVTAYLKFRSFKGDSGIEAWLRGIAHNHLRNFIRKHREQAVGGSAEIQVILEQSCDQWDGARPANDKLDALIECLKRLPESSRALLERRYALGKSVREIGKETGKGYSALTMQFHRLRELLARCIGREMQGGGSEA